MKRRLNSSNFEFYPISFNHNGILIFCLIEFIRYKKTNNKIYRYVVGDERQIKKFYRNIKEVIERLSKEDILKLKEENGIIFSYFEKIKITKPIILEIQNFVQQFIFSCEVFNEQSSLFFPSTIFFLEPVNNIYEFTSVLDVFIKKDKRIYNLVSFYECNYVYFSCVPDLLFNIHHAYI